MKSIFIATGYMVKLKNKLERDMSNQMKLLLPMRAFLNLMN